MSELSMYYPGTPDGAFVAVARYAVIQAVRDYISLWLYVHNRENAKREAEVLRVIKSSRRGVAGRSNKAFLAKYRLRKTELAELSDWFLSDSDDAKSFRWLCDLTNLRADYIGKQVVHNTRGVIYAIQRVSNGAIIVRDRDVEELKTGTGNLLSREQLRAIQGVEDWSDALDCLLAVAQRKAKRKRGKHGIRVGADGSR